jgi:hypothetical protein
MSLWTPPQCSGPCKRVCVTLDNATAEARRAWRTQQRCPMCATLKELGGASVGFRTNNMGTGGIRSSVDPDTEADDAIVYYRNRPETRERRALCALKESNPSLYRVVMEHKNLTRRLSGGRKFSMKNSRMETGATEYDDTKDVEAEAEGDGDGGGGDEDGGPPPAETVPDPEPEDDGAVLMEDAPATVDLLEAEESSEEEGAAAGGEAAERLDPVISGILNGVAAVAAVRPSRRLCVACGSADSVGNEKLCGGCRHFILSQIE